MFSSCNFIPRMDNGKVVPVLVVTAYEGVEV